MADDGRIRLLDAVEQICSTRSPASVTMREVAQEAGVSVGLAYHHFDSKDDLIGCTLDRIGSRIAAKATSEAHGDEGLLRIWALMAEAPAFTRIVTWLVQEGRDVSALMSGHPLIRNTAALAAARGHPDPATAGAVVALLSIAGDFYGPTINRAAGRETTDPRLYEATAQMMRTWLLDADPRQGEVDDDR